MTTAPTGEMPRNPLRVAWREGRCTIGAWNLGTDPVMSEALALAGFDWVCIDLQHGWLGLEILPAVIHASAIAGAAPVVRVPANEPWMIGRALDAGAYGVMVPLVDTAEEARRAVSSCRYAPEGRRSYGAFRTAPLITGSTPEINREVVCMVQVESRSALDDLDGICAVPGLDAVYIGPSDLALSLGLSSGKDHDPRTLLAIRDTAVRHGVAAGMHGESGEEARWAMDNGFAITTAGADVDYLHQAARRAFAIAVGDDPDPATARDHLDRAPQLAV